ncbi:DUF5777 family beta-barrel protein [uncultured Sunxiuqinia sp.]|uniref:DUF5777 family beta-barrel protein n=1 Tax=uncultured Sunxiuqinia sp. TaxID=1573825 RepID=UPI0030D841F5
MKPILLLLLTYICPMPLWAQEDLSKLFADSEAKKAPLPVIATFKSPWIINGQSNETIYKNDLLFVVKHRFGDLAGGNGGLKTFFGLDNSTDILIGFDYGLSNRWSIGLGRAKGAPNGISTHQRQLFYLNTKYRLMRQTVDDRVPVSVSLFGNAVVSTMEELELATSDASFQTFGDRMSYVAQVIIARKFSDKLSLALSPTYVRRNYVSFQEMNNLLALGIGSRVKFSRRIALVVDYVISFRSQESQDYFLNQHEFEFHNPLGVGLEIETGGHVFNLSFTNSTAILENQFIPGTTSSWADGEFRWGFSITRTFTLKD